MLRLEHAPCGSWTSSTPTPRCATPQIHDTADYNDVRFRSAEVPEVPGVAFSPGEDVWLAVDLVDLPLPSPVPEGIGTWLEEPISALVAPTLRHPDPVTRRLLELVDDPPVVFGEEVELESLSEDQLAALGIRGVKTDQLPTAIAKAEQARTAAAGPFNEWISSEWKPWSEGWLEIERGRSFYKQLFDLRTRMERERELIECVWGFGQLRWVPSIDGMGEVRVDHPLLCVAVEFTLEQSTGRITVAPASAPGVESAWSSGLPLSDRAGFNDQRASAEQISLDPWGPGRLDLLRSLLRAIDLDGVLVDSDGTSSPDALARLDPDEWVLFARRRQTNFRGFLDDQRRLYSQPGAVVPSPFAALVIDEPSILDTAALLGDTEATLTEPNGAPTHERLLLPLPTNEQQMQILTLAQTRTGVTAQGPPGTGKSHTIANLISHYVAYGHRVLVTAEKEQTLSVLIDKVPEAIRPLCVPVLGADAAARSRLQATITTIADAAHRPPDHTTIGHLEVELDAIASRFATTTNALRARRAAEVAPVPHRPTGTDPEDWTPSTAAAWLAAHRDTLAGIPDRLDTGAPPPLTKAEFIELEALCASLDPADAMAALSTLPDPAILPPGGRLAALRLEAEQLRRFLSELEPWVSDWAKIDAARVSELSTLADYVSGWATWQQGVADSWVAQVLFEAGTPALARGWEEFCTGANSECEAILAVSRALAANSVSITTPNASGIPGPEFVASLDEARSRITGGRSVGRFQRAAREALDACRVDGRVPSTLDDLDTHLGRDHQADSAPTTGNSMVEYCHTHRRPQTLRKHADRNSDRWAHRHGAHDAVLDPDDLAPAGEPSQHARLSRAACSRRGNIEHNRPGVPRPAPPRSSDRDRPGVRRARRAPTARGRRSGRPGTQGRPSRCTHGRGR